MPLFGRNPNETAYTGGKKHWCDVIKNSSDGKALMWKQPEEDFNTNSTLIVMPGEVAIFVHNGKIEQIFENGTYKLNTENYPFISRIRNAFTGGISTFNCVVYFFRTAVSSEIKWGTETPIQVRDKVFGIRTSARARGSYKVRVDNPAVFLEKLIGSNVANQHQDDLNSFFYSEFQGKIKTIISTFLNNYNNELIGIDAYINDLSVRIQPDIAEALSEYGLECKGFFIAAIDIDTSKYDEIDESQIAAVQKMKYAAGIKSEMDILGDNWMKQKAVDILGNMSQNTSPAGGMQSMGMGLGMGIAGGTAMGSFANELFSQVTAQNSKPEQNSSDDDCMASLMKLKQMLDAGLIDQSDYDKKKNEILSRM